MKEFHIVTGTGRTAITLEADPFGTGLIVKIFNENVHLGAVAVGEYDETQQRASVSVHTRLGHKDDALAQKAAYDISKTLRLPVCVIAGVHLDDITTKEIDQILVNTQAAVRALLNSRQDT
jgi:gallate decarboxylase subunit D